MKMAKKRALIDAALLVGSLSNIFSQDLEDDDMRIPEKEQKGKVYTDQDGTISTNQAKRMFALSKGNSNLVKEVLSKYSYENSKDVKKLDYEKICADIEAAADTTAQNAQ